MKTSLIWGLLLIIIGIILLTNNLGVTDIAVGELIATFWPVVFIIWGLETLLDNKNRYKNANIIWGLILVGLGVAIIARNLGYYTFDLSLIWKLIFPLIVILIGISILLSGKGSKNGNWAVMSGIDKKLEGTTLNNCYYIAIMGGVDLDISQVEVPDGETIISLTAIMGGIDLRVNPELNYVFTNTTLLGSIEFMKNESGGVLLNKKYEHKGSEDCHKTIIINTRCIFGGIEVKQFMVDKDKAQR
ncbi:DUF5668 domain-containing protein [Chitinispirillales bacterium ANBcel5]|uniref:LiaF transmembrane domain-containing protein n=1 Tax=Cellulosispirillum alkaliphilum TaxID=3039283 RepID=UPI002A549DFF|nr:DUF5668 domain-containing protein [Chitinispirillales bacterium ANBcel5]